MTRARGSGAGLRGFLLVVLILLIAQFAIGMVVNLFVDVPAHHPGANAADYFSGSAQSVAWAVSQIAAPWLELHALLGLLLVVAAVALVVVALRSGGATVRVCSVLGLLATIGAGFNGASFLDYNHDFSSMLMAGLFGLACACYVIALHAAPRVVPA